MSKVSFIDYCMDSLRAWGLKCNECGEWFDWTYENEPVAKMRDGAHDAGWRALIITDGYGHQHTVDWCPSCVILHRSELQRSGLS